MKIYHPFRPERISLKKASFAVADKRGFLLGGAEADLEITLQAPRRKLKNLHYSLNPSDTNDTNITFHIKPLYHNSSSIIIKL